eukprot:GHVT01001941.1.p1 GENE.GHVT01001941.1~~GHVT01001941.1.p1  ORF type:complete len:200 (-),score=38.30 GHVT01001941.1:2453-3052(-)
MMKIIAQVMMLILPLIMLMLMIAEGDFNVVNVDAYVDADEDVVDEDEDAGGDLGRGNEVEEMAAKAGPCRRPCAQKVFAILPRRHGGEHPKSPGCAAALGGPGRRAKVEGCTKTFLFRRARDPPTASGTLRKKLIKDKIQRPLSHARFSTLTDTPAVPSAAATTLLLLLLLLLLLPLPLLLLLLLLLLPLLLPLPLPLL